MTISWNKQVTTDKTIHNNKPNIIIRGNEKRKMIDIAVSGGWKCGEDRS